MNYIDFCKQYYATSKIPTNLLKGINEVYSTIGELFSLKSVDS